MFCVASRRRVHQHAFNPDDPASVVETAVFEQMELVGISHERDLIFSPFHRDPNNPPGDHDMAFFDDVANRVFLGEITVQQLADMLALLPQSLLYLVGSWGAG